MQIDPSKSAIQNLLALIDASNPGAPSLPSEVTVSNLITGSFDNGGDTQVTLTGTGPQGSHANFSGSVDVTYKRLSLAAEAASPAGPVPLVYGVTGSALLPVVADYFGFIASEISFTTTPVAPESLPSTSTNTLQAAGSLIYEDGTVDVELSWPAPKTLMLLHADGIIGATSFIDAVSGNAVTGTGGDALTASRATFGSAMGMVQAGKWSVSTPAMPLTGDFTIEGFINIADVLPNTGGDGSHMWPIVFWGQALAASDPINFSLYYIENAYGFPVGGGFTFVYDSAQSGMGFGMPNNGTLPRNTSIHVALVRSQGQVSLYVNGQQIGTSQALSETLANSYSAPMIFGSAFGGATATWSASGALDEFRISNIARYTADFTTPTAPFILD
jgi:Concanavalin A-like lectin/glucanases superfamily